MKRRNADIELFRFLAAIAVVLFHLHICSAGLLAVDFFFILSGALMTRSLVFSRNSFESHATQPGCEMTTFFFKKVKAFYPELLLAIIIGMIASATKDDSAAFLHRCYCAFMNEVCLLRMTALCADPTRGGCPTSWYLSSMMLAIVVVFPIIRNVRNPILLLTCGCLSCGYLVHATGGMQGDGHLEWCVFTFGGNFRAVGEFLLGGATCYAAETLREKPFSHWQHIVLTIVKYLSMVLILLMFPVRYMPTEPMILPLCMCFICLCLSGKGFSPSSDAWYKVCAFLGKMSLPIFLAHWPLVRLLPKLEGIAALREAYLVYPILALALIMLVAVVQVGACYMRKMFRYTW